MNEGYRDYRGAGAAEAAAAEEHAKKIARLKRAEKKGGEFPFDKVTSTSKKSKSGDGNIYFEPGSMKELDLDTSKKHVAGVTEFDSSQYGALTEKKRIKPVPEIVGKKPLTEPLPARKPTELNFDPDQLGAGDTDEPLELDLPPNKAA